SFSWLDPRPLYLLLIESNVSTLLLRNQPSPCGATENLAAGDSRRLSDQRAEPEAAGRKTELARVSPKVAPRD
ncbi:MAG: hypothetical protein ACREXR_18540, partial [Gammaproteobacteria bacterium]